jgi:uncharacterized protein with FMN-binding domain
MKKLLYIVLGVLIIYSFSGCQDEQRYEDGIYYGESEGYYSIIKVEVEVKHGKIYNITILEHNEPEILAKIVFEELPPSIIKNNSVEVDVISGATYTSESLLQAVESALIKNNLNEVEQ